MFNYLFLVNQKIVNNLNMLYTKRINDKFKRKSDLWDDLECCGEIWIHVYNVFI